MIIGEIDDSGFLRHRDNWDQHQLRSDFQFAAIQTEVDLSETNEFEIRCRILPYIAPSPGAMRATGVRVSQIADRSLASYCRMVSCIREKLLEWEPITFLVYNFMQFDEHLLQQAFYKNLLSSYLTNTNGNCPSEVMRASQTAALHMPDAVAVSREANGHPTFKLDQRQYMIAPRFTTPRLFVFEAVKRPRLAHMENRPRISTSRAIRACPSISWQLIRSRRWRQPRPRRLPCEADRADDQSRATPAERCTKQACLGASAIAGVEPSIRRKGTKSAICGMRT